MFDIEFFKKTHDLKKRIVPSLLSKKEQIQLESTLDTFRSPIPNVFNIETTNNCNMKCIMCPRTTHMDRSIENLAMDLFKKALNEVVPHTEENLKNFWQFIEDHYELSMDRANENSFYFYIVARCLTLHGYGEPLLDRHLTARVKEAHSRNIPTYLSCVPANLTLEKAEELMEAGLSVLKVSIDGLTDEDQKRIRGKRNDFTQSYELILEILKMKKEKGYKTLLVPTMIALSSGSQAEAQYRKFIEVWEGRDVFAYIKSQDNRWLYEESSDLQNRSHYEAQYCEYPWTSLTVMADGSIAPCTQDYNNEMILGSLKDQTLEEIWNGEPYRQLRSWHINGNFPEGHKCAERCDQKKIHQYIKLDLPEPVEPTQPPGPNL